MILDQASALRELKKQKINNLSTNFTKEEVAEFLKSLPSPVQFKTIALVIPDIEKNLIPSILKNISFFTKDVKDIAFWDQAGVLNNKNDTLLSDLIIKENPSIDCLYLETPLGMMKTIQRFNEVDNILNGPDIHKVYFLKQLLRSFKSISELWITFKANEIQNNLPLLLATDLACIMVPTSFDYILKSYEAVKYLHLSGFFSTFAILGFELTHNTPSDINLLERIQAVARQFLSIDLQPAGILRSNLPNIDNNEINVKLRSLIDQIDIKKCDFLRLLFEQIINV